MRVYELADLVIRGARNAGYTYAQISRWVMERGDCDLVREDMRGYDAADIRTRIDDVQEAVRTLADEMREAV